MSAPALAFARTAFAAALALPLAALTARAQAPTTGFTLVGHIEAFTLANQNSPISGATLTLRGLRIVLPANLLITMPGGYLTAQDLFRGPRGGAAVLAQSGLALRDSPPPPVPFEAEVVGNIVGGDYIAGVVRISQGALHVGAGYIHAIDDRTGEMRIGAQLAPGDNPVTLPNGQPRAAARVRLNDPRGIYGPAPAQGSPGFIALDQRFALDPDNSPIHARTGFPVCLPNQAHPERCPAANRPAPEPRRFTCARQPSGGTLTPAAAPDAPSQACNPERPVPLVPGDFVTYAGMLQPDGGGGFVIAAHGLEAELGIYTSPGANPVYVFVEEAIQGTQGERFAGLDQEATTRMRIVGFTTDPSRSVAVRLVDSDRSTDPGTLMGVLPPSNGAQLGRFRFTWPAKDDARAVRRDVRVAVLTGGVEVPQPPLPTGLTSGVYVAPVGEYIYPEPTVFGRPGAPLPVPFENFCFLATGGGRFRPLAGPEVTLGALAPQPASGHAKSQQIGTGPARVCGD